MIVATGIAGIANRLKALASCIRLEPENHGIFWRPTINIYIEQNGKVPHRNKSNFSDFFKNEIEVSKPFPKGTTSYNSWRLIIIPDDDIPVGFSDFLDKKGNRDGRNIDLEYNRIPVKIKNIYIDVFEKIKLKKKYVRIINKFHKENFTRKTVCIHMRTWYDIAGTGRRGSFDINNFISRMKKFDPDVNFFVASDSLEHINILKSIFGDRIIVYSGNRIRIIEDDVIDLYLLSKGKTLIGTYMSTFTEVAWWLSGCNKNIEIL